MKTSIFIKESFKLVGGIVIEIVSKTLVNVSSRELENILTKRINKLSENNVGFIKNVSKKEI